MLDLNTIHIYEVRLKLTNIAGNLIEQLLYKNYFKPKSISVISTLRNKVSKLGKH